MWNIDWNSESAAAALKTVIGLRVKWPITEFQVAEQMITAQHSFWYSQAKHSESLGAKALIELVNGGYNANTKTWWDIKATWPSYDLAAEKLTDMTIYLGAQQAIKNKSLASGSLMWPIITRLIMGMHAEKLFIMALMSPEKVKSQWMAILDGSAFMKSCIHPECDVIVDTRRKKSGACCKAHMNYICHHPTCVAKAKNNGWKHYTHRFGTKIAIDHWDYHNSVSDAANERNSDVIDDLPLFVAHE